MRPIFYSIFAFVLVAVIGAGVFLWRNETPSDAQEAAAAQSEDSFIVPTLTPAADGALYENKHYHFSLRIPTGLSGREYKESGGAMTISFEHENTLDGF